MPNILITNDDGIHAQGIQVLASVMDRAGKVTVVAPERNWSASGHPKTLHKPLRVKSMRWPDGRSVYTCSGAPPDCVALALMGAVDRTFDLVVSGINSTYNLGSDVLYSGTVAAAMEAIINDVPAVAVSVGPDTSLELAEDVLLDHAGEVALSVVGNLLDNGIPEHTLLNLNVPPRSAVSFEQVEVTRLGRRIYRDQLVVRDDPWGRPYYWIGGEIPTGIPDDGTDIGAIENGIASLTPLGVDLTRHEAIAQLRDWNLTVSSKPVKPSIE